MCASSTTRRRTGWQRSPVADHNQRTEFFYTSKKALHVLQYFEVMQGRATVNNVPMLYINGAFNVVKRHGDLVMIDLETVWDEYVVRGSRAIHSFTTTDSGFEMYFAIAPENEYVLNCALQVMARRG